MNIKLAEKDDEEKVAQLMEEFMKYYRERHPEWGKGPVLSREELLWSFKDALNNPHEAAIVLVEEDGEPIALSTLTFWHGMNNKDMVITIDDLYVKSRWRNLGVGSKIVHFVVNLGKKMNFTLIEMMPEEKGKKTEKFCKKLGFRKADNDRFQKPIKLAV